MLLVAHRPALAAIADRVVMVHDAPDLDAPELDAPGLDASELDPAGTIS